jgi:hypothetical protein
MNKKFDYEAVNFKRQYKGVKGWKYEPGFTYLESFNIRLETFKMDKYQ